MEARVLELACSLNELRPSSDQEIGHILARVAGSAGEIETSLRAEVVDDVAASVMILSAEGEIVTSLGPTCGVAELGLIADEIVRVTRVHAADGLKLDVELVVLIQRNGHSEIVP